MPLTKKLAAEFVGTFWLVRGRCGSAVIAAEFLGAGIGLLGMFAANGFAEHSPGGYSMAAGFVVVTEAGVGYRLRDRIE